MKQKRRTASDRENELVNFLTKTLEDDEKHIAAAMHLLNKAITLREEPNNGWPTIHACLRNAAMHCEAARKHWTKERVAQSNQVWKRLTNTVPDWKLVGLKRAAINRKVLRDSISALTAMP